MASKGLEMPVSGSEKLEAPVLGCRFSEKAEHLPIKKRRFLFRPSSPPHNPASAEMTGSFAACLDSSNQEAQPKPVASLPPPDISQEVSIDNKANGEKSVKDSDDICGISLGSYSIKSLQAPATIKLEANSVNLPDISAKETGLHISTIPSKDSGSSSPGKATVDKSTPDNQVTSQGQKSAVCDERLNWDLNTVMAWEESPEFDHNIHTTYLEGKNDFKVGNSKGCKQEQESVSASENTCSKISINLRSLAHTIHGQDPQERKPKSNDINKLMFPVISSHLPRVTLNNIQSLHSQNLESSTNASPTIVKLEYPSCDISKKHVNVNVDVNHKNANDSVCPLSVSTGFSLDYSVPLGFNRSINTRPLEENVVSGSNVTNYATTSVAQTPENENLNLSLVTVASLEKEGTTFEEDDKAKVKRVISSNCITMIEPYKAVNQSTIGSLLAIKSSVLPEGEKQSSAVSDVQMPIKPEKSSSSTPLQSNKDLCNNFGFENFRSEIDNVEEFSVGYDSQFEDGEVRESSIQTWEGSEGDNNQEHEHEHEHDTNKKGTCNSRENDSQCAPESSSRIRSTDIGSQKGTDEISSVLLPEKPDTSEHVSNSEPNETNAREVVSMKNESESEQWKMNVSGSDLLADDYTSLNNATLSKTKEFTSMKLYKRESSTRDAFINRGSRFRMQGYSSSNGGDDSGSRSRESGVVRSFRRGTKFSPNFRRGATWNRSPVRDRDPPFFRDVDNLPNLDQNDDVIRPPGGPYVTRQSFRTRLVGNREEDDFRARLGLRPAVDTRFVGPRGRSIRYGPRGYGGPANDDPLEYPHSFPRRRCFSPSERRENIHNHNCNPPCVHHHSGSTSPPRSRTRSRSPRIRRLRSPPNYRFEAAADGYNNNSNSPTRWVKYKQRGSVFQRSSPPIGERLSFYEHSRKATKQNEIYRNGRFSDVHGGVMDHEYRRGGFVKRHEMGRSVKHMEYDDDDDDEGGGYGPVEGMEFHGRGNPKAYSNGTTDTRFRDLPRRPRDERENW